MQPDEPIEDRFLPTRRSLLSRLRNLEDNVSWQDFFETYWKLIYSAATKAGLSDADAEDVVQETVITVTQKIGEFRYDPQKGSFKGWLLNTTRWRILDHLRRRKPHEKNQQSPSDRHTDLIEQIPDPVGEQIEQVWNAEWRQNLIDAAMQRIKRQVKPKHYQIFELAIVKAWPPGKVADALGVNLGYVHLIKHRVGKLIAKEIKRLEAEGL